MKTFLKNITKYIRNNKKQIIVGIIIGILSGILSASFINYLQNRVYKSRVFNNLEEEIRLNKNETEDHVNEELIKNIISIENPYDFQLPDKYWNNLNTKELSFVDDCDKDEIIENFYNELEMFKEMFRYAELYRFMGYKDEDIQYLSGKIEEEKNYIINKANSAISAIDRCKNE